MSQNQFCEQSKLPLDALSKGIRRCTSYECVYIWILNIEFFKIWDDKCLHIYFPNWKALPNASLRRRSQKMFGLKVPCLICKVTFCVKRQHIAFAPLQNFRVKWNVISSFCCLVERSFEKNFVRPNDEIFSLFVRNSFTSFFHNTYNFGGKKRKQKYVDLAVWVACRIRLISHFVRYVNYYSQRSMNFSTESNSLNSNFLTYYNFLNVTVVKKQLKRAQIIKLFLVHYGLGKK